MKIKRIIEIDEDTFKHIDEAKSVPDMFGTDIVNGLNTIKFSKPYDDSGDCISREALIKAIEAVEDNYDGYEPNDLGKFINKVHDIIDNAQAISERPEGEWEHLGGDEWVCSECGHVITTEGSWENPFSTGAYHCENCGADMRGGAE